MVWDGHQREYRQATRSKRLEVQNVEKDLTITGEFVVDL